MRAGGFRTAVLVVAWFILTIAVTQSVNAQDAVTIDYAKVPGKNYDKAEFRLWFPKNVKRLQAVVLLMPGSNGDGRPSVEDLTWQEFATKHNLALVGCRFTDKPHDNHFIEQYVNVSEGSGQALIDALVELAEHSDHPELATAPLLLWGMSAGGQFNYEFVAWKPERVVAFVVNKGGIYYSALVSQAARSVPGLLFVGGKDMEFRTNTIAGLFAVNRRGKALWALAEEPNAGHVVGRSRDMALMFFEDVLPLRLSNGDEPTALRSIPEKSGFIGDLKAKTFQKQGNANVPNYPTAWLPTERTARAWQMLVNDKPFDEFKSMKSASRFRRATEVLDGTIPYN
jgi:poly(3-hydroxybutyrate) depolymerase